MSEPENTTPATGADSMPNSPISEASEVACLQKQINYLTIALVIASMTFCVYMWRQARVARYDLANFKVAAVQVINNYQKDKPQWDAFVAKVAEYGSKHQDFAPIMNKYRIGFATNAPSAAGAIPTVPAQPR